MTTITTLLCCSILLLAGCASNSNTTLLPGLWKVDKVEVMKDGELKKLIVDSSQFWNIYRKDSIEILNTRRVQICLQVRMDRSSIKSIERKTGKLVEEYFIDKLDHTRLELSSRQKIQDADYTVVYYLDRVTGTTIEEIKKDFTN